MWLGHTSFGRIWPYHKRFWGVLATSLILVGVGLFTMSMETRACYIEAYLPGENLLSFLTPLSVGTYVIFFGCLLLGVWVAWLYLVMRLYSLQDAIEPYRHIVFVRARHLRHRHLSVASGILGGVIGLVAAGVLGPFYSSFRLLMLSCIIGGVAYVLIFLAFMRIFHQDIGSQ